jgi:hypothetical protein
MKEGVALLGAPPVEAAGESSVIGQGLIFSHHRSHELQPATEMTTFLSYDPDPCQGKAPWDNQWICSCVNSPCAG